jgi:MFS transporter, putative metabolite:H+ symporter
LTWTSDRLERLPFARFHLKLLAMGGLGYAFDAMDGAIVPFVLPSLKANWALSSAQVGLLASGSLAGGILGAILTGWLGDRFGRRFVMMGALAFYCSASVISATATSWQMFLACRIVTGIGLTAEAVVIAPFLSEFAPSRSRGRFMGALAGCFSFGWVAAALLGVSIVPLGPDAWRVALVLAAVPILMLLWWRRALPESPRWLEAQGRHAEAQRVVSEIESQVQRQLGELPPVINSTNVLTPESPTPSIVAAYRQLWGPSLRRRAAVAWVLWFSIGFSYYAFFTWIPSLLVESGMTLTKSFSFSLAIYVAQIPGYFSAAYFNDRFGRRAVIATYMLMGAVSALVFAFAKSDLAIILAGMTLSLFMNGVYAGLYSYTPEIFPTHVRAMGQGACTAISRTGAMLAPITVGLLFPLYGFPGVFSLTTAFLATGAICAACLGLATKGRSLEDIAISGDEVCHRPRLVSKS